MISSLNTPQRFAQFIALAAPFLVAQTPAFAADKGGEFVLITSTVLPLALYPLGLAGHLCLASLSVDRSASLAQDLADSRWKTLFLGLCNGLALFTLIVVSGKKLPGISAIFTCLALTFLCLGVHGMTRCLGEWVLERCGSATGKFTTIHSLALGWFVFLFVSAIPFVGWCIFFYWLARGLGGVILQLVGESSSAVEPLG